jgi:hypothetical protein
VKKKYPVAAKNARGIIISHPFIAMLPNDTNNMTPKISKRLFND